MNSDVKRAYDELALLRSGHTTWIGCYTTEQKKQVREKLGVGLEIVYRAVWLHNIENDIERAEDIYDLKSILKSVTAKIA